MEHVIKANQEDNGSTTYKIGRVQVHSAKGDVSGQRAMEEEDTGMVSCCRQPSEEEGRLERERERERDGIVGFNMHSTHYRSFRGRFYRSDDPPNGVIALKDDG